MSCWFVNCGCGSLTSWKIDWLVHAPMKAAGPITPATAAVRTVDDDMSEIDVTGAKLGAAIEIDCTVVDRFGPRLKFQAMWSEPPRRIRS